MKKVIYLLSVLLLIFIVSGCNSLGKEKTFDGVELYHGPNISDTLANSLGDYLVSQKFADGNDKTVQITKAGDTYHFRMVVKKDAEKDSSLNKTFKFFASGLSSSVFNGAPVIIELCDDQMSTLKTFASEDMGKTKNVNGVQLLYTKSITNAQVDSLSSFLISSKFANGREKTVQITKSGNIYQFRMVVNAGTEKDPEYIKNAKTYAADLSKSVFKGSPVEVDLCDDYLNTTAAVPMDTTAK
jgi:hypothetical protein